MRTILSTLFFLGCAGALAGQSVPHTTTIPEVATGTYLGGNSSFPLGRTGGRVQYWFRGDGLPSPTVVTAIGPRASRTYTGSARTQSLEVTAANTTLPHAGFTRDFATNLGGSPTIVYARKMLSIPAVAPTQDPDQPGVWIALDAPFPLLGPNLVLDYDLGSAVGAGSGAYNGDLVTLSGTGRHWSSDPSCGGTLTANSTSTSFDLSLSGATPSAPVWMTLALNSRSFGGLPLPFGLAPLGMPGCVLGVEPLATANLVADVAGVATLSLPVSLPSPAVVLYAQAIHTSAVTPVGLATSNVTRSIVGADGFCSYIYNFTVDGPIAQNGPNAWQAAMLLRP
jgi:hypothetical protein